MFKYLVTILIFLNSTYTQYPFSNFINFNQVFLEAPIKCVNFDYQSQNIDGLPLSSDGMIIIGNNIYKIILEDHVFLFQNSNVKRYNKKTNQIFIEYSNPTLDSIIVNFFTADNLNTIKLDSLGIITDSSINFKSEALIMGLTFSTDSSFISSLYIDYDEFNINLFNINFSNECIESGDPFSFNFTGAFTLDLRD